MTVCAGARKLCTLRQNLKASSAMLPPSPIKHHELTLCPGVFFRIGNYITDVYPKKVNHHRASAAQCLAQAWCVAGTP